jgi:hypothetical protein
MNKYIIYRHTLNNKDYVGYTSQTIEERLEEHIKNSIVDLSDRHFHRAIRKYGANSIVSQVIDTAKTKNEAKHKERHYIMELDTFKNGYNMTLGGDGGNTKEKYSDEQMREWKNTISKKVSGMNNSNARPDVTVEVLIDTLVQFIVENDYHDKYILQKEILSELKRVHDVSIEAVKRRAKNVGGLMALVNTKLTELDLVPAKYDPYHRSEEQKKLLAKEAGGYSWVTDGTTNKQVKKTELDKYLTKNKTYKKGRTL